MNPARLGPNLRLAMGGLLLVSGLVMLPGCYKFGLLHTPPNPVEGMTAVAVAPIAISPEFGLVDTRQLGEILSSELVQFEGIDRVVRPDQVMLSLREHRLALDRDSDLRELARHLRVQGVLLVDVTEFSPYYPPRVAVSVKMHLTDSPLRSRGAVITMTRDALAVPVGRFDRASVVAMERVYDSSNMEVYEDAWLYSLGLQHDDRAIDGVDRLLNVSALYFQFVSNRLIADLFGEYSRQLEETHQSDTLAQGRER